MERNTLKIAMVVSCSFPANHGTPGGIIKMCNDLRTAGYEPHIITYNTREYEADFPFPIHRIPALWAPKGKLGVGPSLRRVFFDLMLVFKTIQTILQQRIDVIHAHNYEGQLAGFLAKLLTGRPLVYHAHNNMIDELPQYESIRPKFLWIGIAKLLDFFVPRTADHIVAISSTLQKFLMAKGIRQEKITLVPLLVSTDIFKAPAAEHRSRRVLPEGPKIIYTGTLDTFQRLDYLLKAFTPLTAHYPDLRLVIVANQFNEAQVENVRAMAAGLGISKRLHLVLDNTIEELPFLIGSCDVAVVPRPECPGFPIKILNYMAAGIGIVCFEGSAQILEDQKTALLAKDHDVDDLSRKIAQLLASPELRTRLGREARRSLSEKQSQVDSLVLVYERLVSKRKNRVSCKESPTPRLNAIQ